MYITPRTALVRNAAIAAANGIITLVILLIAPLGLAAVIINTLLVAIASYFTANAADRLVLYLNGSSTSDLSRPNSQSNRSLPDDR